MVQNDAVFPFQDTTYWCQITDSIRNVEDWTPLALAQELHHIAQLQRDKPFKASPEKKYASFLELFQDRTEFEGDVGKLWGGEDFTGKGENFPKIVFWFLKHTLPHTVALLVQLPDLFLGKFPLVDGIGSSHLTLTKLQCAALLAAAFFSVNTEKCQPQPENAYQQILTFRSWIDSPTYSSKAKLFALMNYFERARLGVKQENFEIHRVKLKKLPSLSSWLKNSSPLTNFTVSPCGGIMESCGVEYLHVDFANEYIGGGVLNTGAVQEEIMFSACPELLTSLMFCSVMRDDEALVLVNAERVSRFSGYSTGLKFVGNNLDVESGVARVAIDATCYGWGTGSIEQYTQRMILRDLNKAFVGFNHEFPRKHATVATGNWGCGAFGGNIQLKSLLQWCAASATGRDVRYFTFRDKNAAGMGDVVRHLLTRSLTVGMLMQAVLDYCEIRCSDSANESLYDFVKRVL